MGFGVMGVSREAEMFACLVFGIRGRGGGGDAWEWGVTRVAVVCGT